jgi:poly-beta-1,6-N-acetyl-D-glucosamine synthase
VRLVAQMLLVFVAAYPVVTAAFWIAGGLLFRRREEENDAATPEGGWPGVSILVPAYNEAAVISSCVEATLALDYPNYEVLVLDDGSTDDTAQVATLAGGGDERVAVVRDPVNRGKAERLNAGLRRAEHLFVIVTDADTNMHPLAPKLLVSRMLRSPRLAAVGGSPHVTNQRSLLAALQALEAAAIIGLTRRTQGLIGRTGVVAGVLGLFRRDAVIAVGGYDGRMATEDIDLTWRLLFAGWQTTFEPAALVGMEVPLTLRSLWAQRSRWARGQGEVLNTMLPQALRWRHRRMWPLAFEALASLVWVYAVLVAIIVGVVNQLTGEPFSVLGFGLAWGIAIAVVAVIQLGFALAVEREYDPRAAFAFLLGPLYPLGYWLLAASAAIRHEGTAAIAGPRGSRVIWDVEREAVEGE